MVELYTNQRRLAVRTLVVIGRKETTNFICGVSAFGSVLATEVDMLPRLDLNPMVSS